MIAFAYLTAEGLPTGGGIRPALPEGAVPLPAPWTTMDLARLRYRGGTWEERTDLVPDAAPTKAELAQRATARLAAAREAAIARINARTDAFRRRYYTVIAGQDALYLEKRTEALAYVREADQAGEPATLTDYPLIEGEIGVTAPSAWQLAQVWLNMSAQFLAIGAATESPRQIANNAIALATDETTFWQIEATFAQTLTAVEAFVQSRSPATQGP